MNLVEARFQAYREAAVRLRWFMMITVLISAVISIHTYLERAGFQKHQLIGTYAERVRNFRLEKVECLRLVVSAPIGSLVPIECAKVKDAKFHAWLAAAPADERLETYSMHAFLKARTDNTLKKMTIGERPLPLLGMEVPVNDYVPVLAILLVVFTLGVWLNLRALAASLDVLAADKDPELLRLAQLYFTFTVPLDLGRPHPMLRVVAFLAIWLPLLSLVLGSVADNWPVISRLLFGGEGHLGSIGLVVLRAGLLLACAGVVLVTCAASHGLVKRVDVMMRPQRVAA